jgi:predicted RNase H-like HicB family nuclease
MRRTFTAVIERDTDTGLYVGFVPGFPGSHRAGQAIVEAEFVGTQLVAVS